MQDSIHSKTAANVDSSIKSENLGSASPSFRLSDCKHKAFLSFLRSWSFRCALENEITPTKCSESDATSQRDATMKWKTATRRKHVQQCHSKAGNLQSQRKFEELRQVLSTDVLCPQQRRQPLTPHSQLSPESLQRNASEKGQVEGINQRAKQRNQPRR